MNDKRRYQLLAVGDIFLKNKKEDKEAFSSEIKSLFQQYQHVLVNLETVLIDKGKGKDKAVNLRCNPTMAKYMDQVGITIVNIANNHILDFGVNGLDLTINALSDYKIKYLGLTNKNYQKGSIINIDKNVNIGLLAYTYKNRGFRKYGIAEIEEETVLKDIEILKKAKVNKIIVCLHWGEEYIFYPSANQQKFARKLIDNGVNIIIGHHPHVPQGIEKHKDGIIFYSLGNFNFGSLSILSKKIHQSKWGLAVSLNLSTKKDIEYNIIPITIDDDYKPCIATGRKKTEIEAFIYKISKPLRPNVNKIFWLRETSLIHFYNNFPSFVKRIRKYGFKHFIKMLIWLFKPKTICYYFGIILYILTKGTTKLNQEINN